MIISYSADVPENLSATIYRHFYHREEMETSGICLQLTIADISNLSKVFEAIKML
jgi:hypothetical protein